MITGTLCIDITIKASDEADVLRLKKALTVANGEVPGVTEVEHVDEELEDDAD